PWWRRLLAPSALAWSGAAAAALVVAVIASLYYAGPLGGGSNVVVVSELDHATNVGLVRPIPVSFNQPMDHAPVDAAVRIPPRPTPPPPLAASAVQPLGGSWSWAAWAPDTQAIYLLVGGQVGAVPADGSPVQTLVPDGVKLAALAADGSKLAFVRGGKVRVVGT